MASTQDRRETRPPETDRITADEVGQAVELLTSLRNEAARGLLRSVGLSGSGTKGELRTRILRGLADDVITPEVVMRALDEVEGWGDQHVVLQVSTEAAAERWQDLEHVRRSLGRSGVLDRLNRSRLLGVPGQPELGEIRWDDRHLRVVWVYGQRPWVPAPELDVPGREGTANNDRQGDVVRQGAGEVGSGVVSEESLAKRTYPARGLDTFAGEVCYKAFRRGARRHLCRFDWDLVTGEAFLTLPRMKRESDYASLQGRLLGEAGDFLPLDAFTTLRLAGLIRRLESSSEVSKREVDLVTSKRAEIRFRSAGPKSDAYADPIVSSARRSIPEGKLSGRRGQFYWLATGELQRPIQMRVHADVDRIAIHDQCTESEARYVLARIRHHCR
jgi:hypothetical protein